MAYTISDGLRDREYDKFTSLDTGSLSGVGVILYASASGTGTPTPVLCNSAGAIIMISGA